MKTFILKSFFLAAFLALFIGKSSAAYNVFVTVKGGGVQKSVQVADDGTFKFTDLPPGNYKISLSVGGKKGYDHWNSIVGRVKVQFHWDPSSKDDASFSKTTIADNSGAPQTSSTESTSLSAKKWEDDVIDVTLPTADKQGEIAGATKDLNCDGKVNEISGTVSLENKAKKHIANIKWSE